MSHQLGVDIGSATATAAVRTVPGTASPVLVRFGASGTALPSVVGTDEDGRIVAGADVGTGVGDLLLRMGDPTPVTLRGHQHTTSALLGELLRTVVQAAAEGSGAPDHVVLAHPAGWGPYRREQFAEVPVAAGVDSVELVPAPLLVAGRLSRWTDVPATARVLVCDWGAHTFECSVLQRGGEDWTELGAPDGVERLGGVEVDEAVFALLDERCGGELTRLRDGDVEERGLAAQALDRARAGKEALSGVPATVVQVPLPTGERRELLTRSDLDRAVEPLLEPALAAVARCLRTAGTSPADLHAVILVGGSARIGTLTKLLTRALGRPVHLPSQPEAEVALAAAEWGAAPDRARTATARPPAPRVSPEPTPTVVPPAVLTRAERGRRRRSLRRRRVLMAGSGVLVCGALAVWAGSLADGESPTSPVAQANPTAEPSAQRQPGEVTSRSRPVREDAEIDSSTPQQEPDQEVPASTIPVGQVQLCAHGDYRTYLRVAQPAGAAEVVSPVVDPGQCWLEPVSSQGRTVVISLFGLRTDGSEFSLGQQVYNDSAGAGFGAEGSVEGPFVWRW